MEQKPKRVTPEFNEPGLVNKAQFAQLLGVGPGAISEFVRVGIIPQPTISLGKRRRYWTDNEAATIVEKLRAIAAA